MHESIADIFVRYEFITGEIFTSFKDFVIRRKILGTCLNSRHILHSIMEKPSMLSSTTTVSIYFLVPQKKPKMKKTI